MIRRPLHPRRGAPPRPARFLVAVGGLAALLVMATACGSSSDNTVPVGITAPSPSPAGTASPTTASPSTTSTTSASSATTSDAASGCPFSGQTTPSSGKAQTQVATSLSKVTTRKDNCIDNVQFDFSPGVPAWSVGYQTGPFNDKNGKALSPAGAYFLVVAFQGVNVSYAGPSTISGSGLNYVQGVTEASGTNGTNEWVIGLSQKLQYTTSVSATPAYFVLGIG